jgi:hypothetical protein
MFNSFDVPRIRLPLFGVPIPENVLFFCNSAEKLSHESTCDSDHSATPAQI